MKLIAHRGNIDGPNPEKENSPEYIEQAINLGYDAEIDVWFVDNKIWLGHDHPQYDLGQLYSEGWNEFLIKNSHKLWVHCKNIEALGKLFCYRDLNVFWHDADAVVLTSKNFLWTFPNQQLLPKSICVMPEKGINGDISSCFGICSDTPSNWGFNL